MAELYGVRLYYGTGFNSANRPADVSVLNSATYRDFPSNYLFQNLDTATTRVQAQWSNVRDADYARIGDAYYIIESISMLSPATAEIKLFEDPVLTLGGVSAIRGVNGWAERAHVAGSNDGMFSNTLAEPWAPSQTLHIDPVEKIGLDTSYNNVVSVIQSTVKLEDMDHVAEVYETSSQAVVSGTVTVPLIPEATTRCQFLVTHPTLEISGDVGYKFPFSSFYDYSVSGVQEGVQDVRSLGIDSAVISAYSIPRSLLTTVTKDSNGVIRGMVAGTSTRVPSNNMLFRYGSYSPKNTKVYALYNTYSVLSSCSGDSMQWEARDLYNGADDRPYFWEYCDPGPEGMPYIQPTYYHGARVKIFQESVKGAPWLKLPLTYTTRSGELVAEGQYKRDTYSRYFEAIVSGVAHAYTAANQYTKGDYQGALGTAGSAIADVGRRALDLQDAAVNYLTEQTIIAPEVRFAQNPGSQGYVGNTFYIYRTRLSDSDMERFDNFLTQFGYAQDKKFELSDLTNRTYFNFIKTRDAEILGVNAPLRVRQNCASLFNSGVRLWHVLPNTAAMTYNP